MIEKLAFMHGDELAEKSLARIEGLLEELYGKDLGSRNYRYLTEALNRFLESQSEEDLQEQADFDPQNPYAHLAGKIFAICYPDNIYDHVSPTLKTLEETLGRHFPAIKGIHILPERTMSHSDLWPQDLLHLAEPEIAVQLTGQPGGVRDAAVMGEKDPFRSERENPVHRRVSSFGIEVHRGRRGKQEMARVRVEFPV